MSEMFYLLKFCMLFALLVPIVCPNSEMFTTRRDRSSLTDNPKSPVKDKPRDIRSKASQKFSNAQQPGSESKKSTDINARIREIFNVVPSEGTILFNNTFDRTLDHMHADDPMVLKSSHPAETFKVQRTPDGKLNVVFNEFLFLQTKTTTRPKIDAIIFPGPTSKNAKQLKCEDEDSISKGFCTKVNNYPEISSLESILKREYSNFFGEDLAQPQNITQRMNYDPDEEDLCRSNERVIYPEAAEAKDSNWLVIVNRNDFVQGVRIEECSEEGETCRYTEGLPKGVRAYCKQHYIYRTLVAVRDNTTVTKEHFKMPSCCKCVIKKP